MAVMRGPRWIQVEIDAPGRRQNRCVAHALLRRFYRIKPVVVMLDKPMANGKRKQKRSMPMLRSPLRR
jgi:hypothetical protein